MSGSLHLLAGAARRSRDGEGERCDMALAVPSDLLYFRGHFDGDPILPAVVQLHEVVGIATRAWPDLGPLRRVLRLKFRRPIRPDDALALELVRTAARVAFELRLRGEGAAQGLLEFEAAP